CCAGPGARGPHGRPAPPPGERSARGPRRWFRQRRVPARGAAGSAGRSGCARLSDRGVRHLRGGCQAGRKSVVEGGPLMADANFSAKDVQTLRQQTGAGMMDAKRALTESGGNMEDAARWLREKGLAQSAKRSDRAAEQGAVSVANTGSVAAAVELKCETDFVAKSPDFVALVEDLADA